jgi:hypothetical protein
MLYFTKQSQNGDNKVTINFNTSITSNSENISDYDVEVSSIVLSNLSAPNGYLYYSSAMPTSALNGKPKYQL